MLTGNNILDRHFCIIGSGIAGIIFALETSKLNPKIKISIIEFGIEGLTKNKLDDSIVLTQHTNHHSPYECTNKGFGGTSRTWGGRCVSYDGIDFSPRKVLKNNCTWNLELFHELQPFYKKASSYFETGSPSFNTSCVENLNYEKIAENFKQGDVTDSSIERWSMPTRFKERYKTELLKNPNITYHEGYDLDSLVKDQEGKITSAEFKSWQNDNLISIKADKFIISAGAQESTRILLKQSHIFNGIPTSLGKYYQGHISGKIASVKFYGNPRITDFGFEKDGEIFVRRRFQLTNEALEKNSLLNTAIWLDNPLYVYPEHKSGSMSLMYLAMITPFLGKKLGPPAMAYSITKGITHKIGSHILNVLKDFPKSFITPLNLFYRRYLKKRKLPDIFLYNPENRYALHFHAEQEPVISNSMSLEGKNLVIDCNISELDVSSVIETHEILDNHLRNCDCGELEYWFPKENLAEEIKKMSKDGIHQNGTTRMATTKELGVVDFDLKVFDTENLYVCSSSTFPTSSQANPTFMLGVFAVRLAKHIIGI